MFVEGFESAHQSFCDFLGIQRNSELHTGDLPFENLRLQQWLQKYYEIVEIFCRHLGHELEDLLGPEEAEATRELLKTSAEGLESSVKGDIAAFKKVFDAKPEPEKDQLRDEARVRVHLADVWTKTENCPVFSSALPRPGIIGFSVIFLLVLAAASWLFILVQDQRQTHAFFPGETMSRAWSGSASA
ncbi:MAG: hypothetical protein IIB26_08625 [Chloroflexi bacterium]|nr:hypothetical protein [Chloroflexota bacterium]